MVRRLSALVLIAVMAACSDSTGPQDFSPTTTQQKVDAVLSAFDGNTALRSLAVLGPAIQFSVAQPALATVPFDPTTDPVTVRNSLEALRGGLSLGTSATLALFPADLLGHTFVYDVQTARYVQDAQRTDAPSNGVRMVLYAVDPVLSQVIQPLQEIGYLDLTDESTPSADALGIKAVVGSTTYLDYTATATRTTTSGSISAEGYISNGSARVDFDLSLTVTASSIAIDYQLTSGSNSVGLVGTIGPTENDVDATVTVKGGNDTVVLEVTVSASTISGQITYNGDEVVVISGGPDSPTFTRPDGTALTQDEIAALNAIGNVIGTLFDAFDNLLGPALVVFAFG